MRWLGILLLVVASIFALAAVAANQSVRRQRGTYLEKDAVMGRAALAILTLWCIGGAVVILR